MLVKVNEREGWKGRKGGRKERVKAEEEEGEETSLNAI